MYITGHSSNLVGNQSVNFSHPCVVIVMQLRDPRDYSHLLIFIFTLTNHIHCLKKKANICYLFNQIVKIMDFYKPVNCLLFINGCQSFLPVEKHPDDQSPTLTNIYLSEGIPGSSTFPSVHKPPPPQANLRLAKMKNTGPLCWSSVCFHNQFHLDSVVPLERLQLFAQYNSNTRWISKAINHTRQGTALQL